MRVPILRLACLALVAWTILRSHAVLGPIRVPEDCAGAACAGEILHPHRLWFVAAADAEGATLVFEGRRWRSEAPVPGARAGDSLEAAVEVLDPATLRVHSFVLLRHIGLRTALSAAVSLLVLGLLGRRALRAWGRRGPCPSC